MIGKSKRGPTKITVHDNATIGVFVSPPVMLQLRYKCSCKSGVIVLELSSCWVVPIITFPFWHPQILGAVI